MIKIVVGFVPNPNKIVKCIICKKRVKVKNTYNSGTCSLKCYDIDRNNTHSNKRKGEKND